MKNFQIITTLFILSSLALVSCSTNKMASTATQDNLYFMASDAKSVRANAVPNNKPESFQNLSVVNDESFSQENFSSRNVNPDYIAKYQSEAIAENDETIYFEENNGSQGTPNIDVYNNYYSAAPGSFGGFNNSFNSGLGFGGFGMGGFGMGGFGMGGFGSPFGFGFGPRLSLGFGFGSPWMNPMFGYGMPMMGFGMPMMGFGMPMFGYGMPMMGYGYGFNRFPGYGFGYPNFGNQIFVLPGSEYSSRGVSVGARPSRGASLSGNNYRGNSSAATVPSTARAQARNAVLNNNNSSRRITNGGENSRVSSRDFGTSQNDYYSNSRSRVGSESTRNVNSPAADRGTSTRSRSAMPSATPSNVNVGNNSRTSGGSINTPSRSSSSSSSPSYNRSNSNPSYSRSSTPTNSNNTQRSSTSNPSYNRSSSGTSNYSTPSRSNAGSGFSTPSRSSGGSIGGSSGGSSSGGSRSGRGN